MSGQPSARDPHAQIAEAEKKLGSKTGFLKSFFGSSSSGPEEAAELFTRAGNQFKLSKKWDEAGHAFSRAAAAYETAGGDYSYDAASKYAEAGKMYKNLPGVEKAVGAFEAAVRIFTDGARFQQSARYMREIAELHDGVNDLDAARKAYEIAADLFDGEDSKSHANSMRVRIASIAASQGDYAHAAKLFEDIAAVALESRLLKYGARDHLLRAGFCRCVDDLVGASRALERYKEMDSSFAGSREEELLSKILGALTESDVQAFTNAVYEFDSISKLDDWKTKILLKIKNSIRDAEDDLT